MFAVFSVMILTIAAALQPSTTSPADEAYRAAAEEYWRGHYEWRPQSAVALGLHEYDGRAPDLSMQSIQREHDRLSEFRAKLASMDEKSLSPRNAIQLRMLLCTIDGELFSYEVMDSYRRNPMTYAGAIDVNIYAKRDFAPKPDRLRSVVEILRHVPGVTAAGRANLHARLAKTYIETAIQIADGGASFLVDDLVKAFEDVKDDALQSEFKAVRERAAAALREFSQYLKAEKLPKADDDFAIGRGAFARMLRETELIDESPEEILAIGMAELKRQQEAFAAAAKVIDPAKSAPEVFKEIQRDHPTAESLLPDTRKHLEMMRDFILKRDLITFPSDVRVQVDNTPRFDRATSFASMDTPGPFETKATEAYYYVTPVEPEWDEKKAEEWLTAFNYYTTDVVSIHEAYPGHYVQNLHLNASDADKIDKSFGSYAFSEGWAHYCEQMVLDEGFPGGDEVLTAKYRLAQASEALLRCCRLVAAIRMHTQGMSLDEATQFFIDNCYYEQATARAEAERGTYDPGYCLYTIGKLQFLKLRDDYRKQEGTSFSLKKFHNESLRHGSPPLKLLRRIMLKDSGMRARTM